jgi:hypothetical protein
MTARVCSVFLSFALMFVDALTCSVLMAREASSTGGVGWTGTSHALIISMSNYRDSKRWWRLDQTRPDAEHIEEALKKQGFQDIDVRYDLTSSELAEHIERFFREKGRNENSRLFFWFAGHGHTKSPSSDDSHGKGYILGIDAPRPEDPNFDSKAMSFSDFQEAMQLAKSRHVMAVFDSCFSGYGLEVVDTRGAIGGPTGEVARYLRKPVRRILTSGTKNQTVRDDGKFAQAFVRAISGGAFGKEANPKGFVTGDEVAQIIRRDFKELGKSHSPQTAVLKMGSVAAGDFVFSTVGTAVAAPIPHRGWKDLIRWPRSEPVSPSLNGQFERCVYFKPLRREQAENVAARLEAFFRTRKLEYLAGSKGADAKSAEGKMVPRGVKSVEARGEQLYLNMEQGEVLLRPVIDPRANPGSTVDTLQGAFVQNNSYGCIDVRFNPEEGTAKGVIRAQTDESPWAWFRTSRIPIELRSVPK